MEEMHNETQGHDVPSSETHTPETPTGALQPERSSTGSIIGIIIIVLIIVVGGWYVWSGRADAPGDGAGEESATNSDEIADIEADLDAELGDMEEEFDDLDAELQAQ